MKTLKPAKINHLFRWNKMKKLPLIFFLLLFSLQIKAQQPQPWMPANWVLLADMTMSNGYGNKRFFDSSHVTKNGNDLSTYILRSENYPIPMGSRSFQSTVMYAEYDCKKKLWSASHFYLLTGKNGDGEIVKEFNGENKWVEFIDQDKKLITTYCK